jgi:hypothetical protein
MCPGAHVEVDNPTPHSTEFSEVCYPWHPWFGRAVAVYEVVVKEGHGVWRCGFEEERNRLSIEVPAWMFEAAACRRLQLMHEPAGSCDALRALQTLLRIVPRSDPGGVLEAQHRCLPAAGGAEAPVRDPPTTLATDPVSAPPSRPSFRDARHDLAVAPAAHRAEMDAPEQARWPSRCPRRDSTLGRPDGGRESHLGLHVDPRSPQESWASCWPLDDRPDSQEARTAAGAGAADLVADVSSRALGRGGRGRFLHDGSLDMARIGDVLHRLRDRPRITACSTSIIASGIIKASRIGSSRAGHVVDASTESVGVHGSVAC